MPVSKDNRPPPCSRGTEDRQTSSPDGACPEEPHQAETRWSQEDTWDEARTREELGGKGVQLGEARTGLWAGREERESGRAKGSGCWPRRRAAQQGGDVHLLRPPPGPQVPCKDWGAGPGEHTAAPLAARGLVPPAPVSHAHPAPLTFLTVALQLQAAEVGLELRPHHDLLQGRGPRRSGLTRAPGWPPGSQGSSGPSAQMPSRVARSTRGRGRRMWVRAAVSAPACHLVQPAMQQGRRGASTRASAVQPPGSRTGPWAPSQGEQHRGLGSREHSPAPARPSSAPGTNAQTCAHRPLGRSRSPSYTCWQEGGPPPCRMKRRSQALCLRRPGSKLRGKAGS